MSDQMMFPGVTPPPPSDTSDAVSDAASDASDKRVSVRPDAAFLEDLKTLQAVGVNASDAIRAAVALTAGMYRISWQLGYVPQGVTPQVIAWRVSKPTHPGLSADVYVRQYLEQMGAR